ncbi:tetratricopeptide repeat protein [Paenactinomyces guangxiensis]|uniref:Helix-turn-helix transcriptional regulator n=1 Tax=Paenactinomyces guangxiensis TaxID=1490290 RepID=A0A7W2AB14_9BACL|nr:tetratricopeptide repeat protein [Paenactinomyces guangxiensis]MBA4496428.1 helix-turn-helix transcriptional regulator [Paenactinomyces guangxiensis]MBH8593529.1 helix-turn-helix transcriptional regulator [Paenactinomyces guangxiensis]
MLEQLDIELVRYIIRKARKELGLRQKDIEDGLISSASISNVERGEEVRPETFDYLLKKLGIDSKTQLPQMIQEEEKKIEVLKFHLESIETMLENGDLSTGIDKLNQISMEDFHPLSVYYSYLKALYHHELKEWKKAEKNFDTAIRHCNHYSLRPKDNIIAVCYNKMSTCKYNQGNLKEALDYVEQGLNAVDEGLERNDIKYHLLSNQIIYLLKSSQSDQASQILLEVWPFMPKIDRIPIRLDLYKSRSIILRGRKLNEEAIQYCEAGIQLARKNNILNRYLDLLNVLGSIYIQMKEYDQALLRFQTAIDLDKEEKYPRRHLDTNIYLGILYSYQDQWERSIKHLTKAIGIGREIPDIFRLTKALIVMGDIYFRQNQFEQAVPYYQEASFLTEKHNYRHRQYTALLQLSICFDMIDKKDDSNKCMTALRDLLFDLKITTEGDEFYGI